MNISNLPQLVRNTARLNEIVSVLTRYGLAPWLKDIKADWIQRHLRTSEGQQISELSQPVRIRLALTELGTTFIKFGQVLSTRGDLVGPELSAELAELQSGTPPDSPETVVAIIKEELDGPPEQFFSYFETQAFASASIGQVHHARLLDGTAVVVKIQHAGIEERIKNDLEILIELARAAESYAPQLSQYRPLATVTEFKKILQNELDFTLEQRNLNQFARNFSEDPGVYFPTSNPELCTRRILTMDCMNGVSLSKRDDLIQSGFGLSDLARRGANMFVQMVFRDGFYHADPHPGNLMVLEGQVIGVLDCGMVGRVDDDLREQIEDILLAAVAEDPELLLDGVLQIGEMPSDFDREELKTELITFVEDFGSQSIDKFDLSGALNRMITIIRCHNITLPSRVSLLIKMLVMLEGTAQQLSPEFSLAELLEPYRSEAVKRRFSPERIWRKIQRANRDWSRLLEALPRDLADIMVRVRRGSFNVHLEHRRLDSIVNRLVMGILSAALFVGSASLWSNNVKPLISGVSVPGAVGCGIAVYLGFKVMRAIKNSGNLRDSG